MSEAGHRAAFAPGPSSAMTLGADRRREFYSRYQIWHYHYRTGTPVLYNAAVLRRILGETLSAFDPSGSDFATNHLVVLGHSMGGIMTYTLLCDSGYKLWDSVITVRPERFACDANTAAY